MRHRGNHKNRYYRAGLLLSDVSEHRKRLYGLLEVGDAFGYTKFEKFRYILLPYASADILVGMRIGMGYSWRAIIAAEMIAASSGIGHLILFAQQLSRTDKVIVGIFVVGLVGLATDKCFGFLLKKLFKGNGENGWN